MYFPRVVVSPSGDRIKVRRGTVCCGHYAERGPPRSITSILMEA
jgi:hypothetical protein